MPQGIVASNVPQHVNNVQEILTNVLLAMIALFLMDKLVNHNQLVELVNI